MTSSDLDMARAAAGGDRAAFSALLERHYDSIFRLAFRLTGSRTEAEDLTQDVCIALPVKLRGFRAEARFTTWLFRVVVNASHDRRRRATTHERAAKEWGEWEVERRATVRDTEASSTWLKEAMRALPGDLRDTLALILDRETTQAEAAAILGVSEGTVAWRMSEVKKRLRAVDQEEQT